MSFFLHSDPNSVKSITKTLAKESQREEKHVKHLQKDLSQTGKEARTAAKNFEKAQSDLHKLTKAESDAAGALNKATHYHEIAISNVATAEKDLEIKSLADANIKHEVEMKKAAVEAEAQKLHTHNQEREHKMSVLHGERAGDIPNSPVTPNRSSAIAASPVATSPTVSSPAAASPVVQTASPSMPEPAPATETLPIITAT
ncbi:hypothetical protein C8J56DRAFT_1170400 [Mycena floridula]|nr:hypothetical protein C8J56DRAFT_1170400 [Mycena floridula]